MVSRNGYRFGWSLKSLMGAPGVLRCSDDPIVPPLQLFGFSSLQPGLFSNNSAQFQAANSRSPGTDRMNSSSV